MATDLEAKMLFTMKFLEELPIYEVVQPYKVHGFPELSVEQQTNCVFKEIKDVAAEDLRDFKDKCRFEEEGFEFMKAPTRCALSAEVFERDSFDMNDIVRDYIQETMDLVRERLDARFVVTIDWRFRRNDAAAFPQRLEAGDIRKQAIAVATTVHCDFSYIGGLERLRMHLTEDEWSAIKNGSVKPMIVNVWRPLVVVRNAPLVLADRRTVFKRDLIEADQVMSDKVNKTAYAYYRSSQKWYWLSNQSPEEITMFATWAPETKADHADFSPHAAAYLYQPDKLAPPRQSVEVRMIIFTAANSQPEMCTNL